MEVRIRYILLGYDIFPRRLRMMMEVPVQTLKPPSQPVAGTLHIPFIKENLLAEHVATDGTRTMLAPLPDLIAAVDKHSGRAVGLPEHQYGCYVIVLGISCPPRWTHAPRGPRLGGSASYGYDGINCKSICKYVKLRSVIAEDA